MQAEEIFALGLGLTPPWKVMSQRLDTKQTPSKLHLEIGADRGALYPCPECGAACKAHDFKEFTWRHLNFFQHHYYKHAIHSGLKNINKTLENNNSSYI